MPMAALQRCSWPGCTRRQVGGRCDPHQALTPRNRKTPDVRARYRTPEYTAAKAALAEHDLPCTLRLPGCTGLATVPDHGPHGLRPACAHCNSADGAARARAAGPR